MSIFERSKGLFTAGDSPDSFELWEEPYPGAMQQEAARQRLRTESLRRRFEKEDREGTVIDGVRYLEAEASGLPKREVVMRYRCVSGHIFLSDAMLGSCSVCHNRVEEESPTVQEIASFEALCKTRLC
jgi:hypothetical protein